MPIYRGEGGAGTTEDVAVSSQTAADALTATTQATNAATSASQSAASAATALTRANNAAASAAAALISQNASSASEINALNSANAAAASAASATSSDFATSSWFTTTNNATDWDTAYGWGNYADAIGVTVQAYDASTLKSADIGVTVQGYDATLLADADIGVTVQAYDATILKSSAIGVSVQGFDADTAKTDVNASWTASQRGPVQTTSITGSTTLDFDAYQHFVLTLTGNVTLANPSTEAAGQSGFIVFIQDGTGGRTVSLGSDYETAGASGVTLSTAASTSDIIPYVVAATGRILLGNPQKAFS